MADQWSGFYSPSQAARLTRIPPRTLSRWKQRGFIGPSLIDGDGDTGYSYADLTILRLLRAIRERRLDFRSAGLAFRHLYERLGPPSTGWSRAIVEIRGRQVFAYLPDEWDVTEATKGGQTLLQLSEAFSELRSELVVREGDSFLVPPEFRQAVTINPAIRGGEPVVRGTRIPTSLIAALHARGETAAQIARDYGSLPRAVITRVIAYEQALDHQAIDGASAA